MSEAAPKEKRLELPALVPQVTKPEDVGLVLIPGDEGRA